MITRGKSSARNAIRNFVPDRVGVEFEAVYWADTDDLLGLLSEFAEQLREGRRRRFAGNVRVAWPALFNAIGEWNTASGVSLLMCDRVALKSMGRCRMTRIDRNDNAETPGWGHPPEAACRFKRRWERV